MKTTRETRDEAEAVERAKRAKEYADKFPTFIRAGDKVFQTKEWQVEMLSSYREKVATAKE